MPIVSRVFTFFNLLAFSKEFLFSPEMVNGNNKQQHVIQCGVGLQHTPPHVRMMRGIMVPTGLVNEEKALGYFVGYSFMPLFGLSLPRLPQ